MMHQQQAREAGQPHPEGFYYLGACGQQMDGSYTEVTTRALQSPHGWLLDTESDTAHIQKADDESSDKPHTLMHPVTKTKMKIHINKC